MCAADKIEISVISHIAVCLLFWKRLFKFKLLLVIESNVIQRKVSSKEQKLTGIFSLTSHKRNVLSVDADASSVDDRNFTYETAFLCPLNTWSGLLMFLKS